MKKLPRDAEASNVLVGEVDFLDAPFVAFVRLQQAVMLGALTEVPVPTRCLKFCPIQTPGCLFATLDVLFIHFDRNLIRFSLFSVTFSECERIRVDISGTQLWQ